MMDKNPSFLEIKKELVERVERIEEYMKEGIEQRKDLSDWMKKVHIKVYGDEDSWPPKLGIETRLKTLEAVESDRIKIKQGFLKVAVGSLTMAIGGAVIWVFNVLREAFTRVH